MRHNDLTPSFGKVIKGPRSTKTSATKAHGRKVMQEGEDTEWVDEAGEPRSVRRFAVELDDTTERAEALAERIAEAEAGLVAAGERLSLAREALAALDARVVTSSLQVSRGPVPPGGAPLGAQWLTPEGYLYVRVDCDEEAA